GRNRMAGLSFAPRRSIGERASRAWKFRGIYGLSVIPLIFFLVIRYLPLWNAQIAFKEFSPLDGVWGSPWNGFDNFAAFFRSPYLWPLLRNTVMYSMAKLVLGIPAAVFLALALYETGYRTLRKVVQTLAYLPHFLSWIIMHGILLGLFSAGEGLFNEINRATGVGTVNFLGDPAAFPWIIVFSDLWKEMGWGAIVFLAALIGIDPALYESAQVEGASRLQQVRYITLPGILEVIIVVALLRIGTILDAGFHQLFVLYSVPVYDVGDIIDTWVYRQGILNADYSIATAVGLFKGLIGLAFLLVFNRIARLAAGSGLY
ncbi:MAG TPA: ABC transporter permease subunit, partial [Magnetospirillaceae bacterium]|nr:ABC transporter permease subunit [Magnetospirillaceae bacterium]